MIRVLACLVGLLVAAASAARAADRPLRFNRDVRPILSDTCFACHGFDAPKRQADLRLDTAEGARAVTASGRPAIVPGDPEGSEAWLRIVSDDPDLRMPVPESLKTLADGEQEIVRRWILAGAAYEPHWEFPFTRHANAEGGLWVSDLLRKTGEMAGEICVVKSMTTEQINHGPGITFMQTGHPIPGRPSMGAWLSYGLGSLSRDLPSFVVMISTGRGQVQALFAHLWRAGFLSGQHQGVQFRAGGGIRRGISYGETDEFSYNVARDPVTAHDLHATMLRCLGIDHERLTFRS